MESRNKLAMCRLCLCENECFVNVFELNDGLGYVAAEVISDLLRFQVYETDGYPHVVCSKCLEKLTDFKLFKECCQKSRVKYDSMFDSSENLEEHQPETVEFMTVKVEPIFYSDNEENLSKDEENVSRTSDYSSASANPACSNAEGISSDLITPEITIKEEPLEEQLIPTEAGAHPQHLQSLEQRRGSHYTSTGTARADSCTWNISTNDESIFETSKNTSSSIEVEASSSGQIERLEGQSIHQREIMYMHPPFQRDLGIEKKEEMGWEREERERGDGEGGSGTAPKEGVDRKVERLECNHCGNVLMTKRGLIRHMAVHGFGNSYGCGMCGKLFPSKANLNSHVLTHTGSKPYKCAECSKCFSQSGHLKRHMISHTGSKPYKCSECSKCYSQSTHLVTHMRSHTGLKPYICAECGKGFAQSSNLKKHMSSHSGLKPYKCAECSKCFSNNHILKTHMMSHTGSKPFKCAECSKCFTQNGSLKTHMRSHMGSKPYKCEHCSKCFSQSSNLNKHMRTHMNKTI